MVNSVDREAGEEKEGEKGDEKRIDVALHQVHRNPSQSMLESNQRTISFFTLMI